MNYIDSIQKFTGGKKYAGDTIQTSDGKLAYVTRTGITKPYETEDTYNATSNKFGCKSTPISVDRKWADLGFPVGSQMVDGQSCGNEGKYVQSGLPKNDFDAEYYIKGNGFTDMSAEQALDHWKSTGMNQGLQPNDHILNSMASLGKVGYVDLNTQLHNIPKVNTSTYNSFPGSSNVKGANMEDCTPIVRYGEPLYVTFNSAFGFPNDSSQLEFGDKKTPLYLRPEVSNWNNFGEVKYGDTVSISTTSDWWNNCGWWGCKVGTVNPETLQMEFGPGSGMTTFILSPPKGTAYQFGEPLRHGGPFTLVATVIVIDDTLEQDTTMYPGHSLRSKNGQFTFVYQTDGNLCIYDMNGQGIWCSMKLHTPGRFTMQSDGNLVAYDTSNVPNFSIPVKKTNAAELLSKIPRWMRRFASIEVPTGQPFKFVMQNDGNGVVYNGKNEAVWSTNTARDASTVDVSSPNIGYVNKNNRMAFGEMSLAEGKCIFSCKPLDLSLNCRIPELQSKCTGNSNCNGFIHSVDEKTWQPITNSSTRDDFRITPALMDVYVKEGRVQFEDESCTPGNAELIDPSQFEHYTKGDDFTSVGKGQCKLVETTPINTKKNRYDNVNSRMNKSGETIVRKYSTDNEVLWRNKNNQLDRTLKAKKNKYIYYDEEIKKFKDNNVGTYEQQKIDSEVMNMQNKMHAVAWALLAVITLSIVISRTK